MPADFRAAVSAEAMGGEKLLEGEKVEVRFLEEGLNGSWNQGTVIGAGKLRRFVEYDHLDAEDGLSKLVEFLDVSLAIEGSSSIVPENYRGTIRPSPPHRSCDRLEIRYGMCVDAEFDNAWWEGVVFDREEGSFDRLIFFPDQGDQHLISINQLRPTFDWNEVTGEWKARSDWVMLKVLDSLGKDEPLPVSIRQIWYDISCMDVFVQEIGEWLFGSQTVWHGLVLKVLTTAFSVAQGQHVAQIVPVSESVSARLTSDAAEITAHGSIKGDKEIDTGLSDEDAASTATGKQDCFSSDYSESLVETSTEDSIGTEDTDYLGDSTVRRDALPELRKNIRKAVKRHYVSRRAKHCSNLINSCGASEKAESFDGSIDDSLTTSDQCSDSSSENINRSKTDDSECKDSKEANCIGKIWKVANCTGKYCPEAIFDLNLSMKKRVFWCTCSGKNLIASVREHLVALGWMVYCKKDPRNDSNAYSYYSPDGFKFYTLRKVYLYFIEAGACLPPDEDHPDIGRLTRKSLDNDMLVGVPEECRKENSMAENCPGAIEDYVSYMQAKYSKSNLTSYDDDKEKRLKAKKHLLYLGWTISVCKIERGHELRYSSPSFSPQIFFSLLAACTALLNKKIKNVDTAAIVVGTTEKSTHGCQLYECKRKFRARFESSRHVNCKMPQGKIKLSDSEEDTGYYTSHDYIKQSNCRAVNGAIFFSEGALTKKHRAKKLCRRTDHSIRVEDFDVDLKTASVANSKSQKNKSSRVSTKCFRDSCKSRIKQAQDVSPLSPGQHVPCTIISWLIDNDVVLPRQKVRYVHQEDGQVTLEGRLTRDGISCNCCKKVYTLANFEVHAGSPVNQPAANIFLHDGRSLWDCQRQILKDRMTVQVPRKRTKGNNSIYSSDSICSMCNDGGDLILCDSCPSTFHLSCAGLEGVPEGDWFCPSCQCSICRFSRFNSDSAKFSEGTILFCDQCECEFHVRCISQLQLQKLTCCPEGPWFCSESCSRIFLHLRGIVGKQNPTPVEGISWTLLRSQMNDSNADNVSKEIWIEHHSKLCLALDVLHECFVSLKEPRTNTDLVEDLLFNKESELRRLNFWGFYTMLLEKGDELISVATIRVYGDKVAEMPFVGTRVQYRRRGMCRILINELEKLLKSIGVERLVLPAVPQLLQTWKSSFGFHDMPHSDRLSLSRHVFLSFQGTTMCQKLLKLPAVVVSEESTDDRNGVWKAILHGSNNTSIYCNSTTSCFPVVEKMQLLL